MENVNTKEIVISKIDGVKRKSDGEVIAYNICETVELNVPSAYTSKTTKDVKFTLWLKKQDGSFTKAFQQFKERRLMIGDRITVFYKEEPREYDYVDKKTGETKVGKSVNRTILFFGDAGEQVIDPDGTPLPKEMQPIDENDPMNHPF